MDFTKSNKYKIAIALMGGYVSLAAFPSYSMQVIRTTMTTTTRMIPDQRSSVPHSVIHKSSFHSSLTSFSAEKENWTHDIPKLDKPQPYDYVLLPRVLDFTTDGVHKISYVEWGDSQSKKVVLCVHGMSRNGRDFDYLAKELVVHGYRVICPDLPGSGRSDWHKNSDNYNILKNVQVLRALTARLNIEKLDWIGTSLGGMIGMILASSSDNPIQKLIMNDVGSLLPVKPVQRIIKYLSLSPTFNTQKEAKKYLQHLLSPCGPLEEEHIDHMVKHSFFSNLNGQLQLAYDPQILSPVTYDSQNLSPDKSVDVDLWHLWETITIPVFVLRGANSEVLTKKILDQMLEKEQVSALEFPNVGHAPALMSSEQINPIIQWLED